MLLPLLLGRALAATGGAPSFYRGSYSDYIKATTVDPQPLKNISLFEENNFTAMVHTMLRTKQNLCEF
jgi:hypothetical protein